MKNNIDILADSLILAFQNTARDMLDTGLINEKMRDQLLSCRDLKKKLRGIRRTAHRMQRQYRKKVKNNLPIRSLIP